MTNCSVCGNHIISRRPHAKYCKTCANLKKKKSHGKSGWTYKKRIDFVEEFAEIVEFARNESV
jgi:RNA polymerase-binding transcription factor DksA